MVTLITVQNTQQVSAVQQLDPALIVQQLDAVLEDIEPAAAKTGALGNLATVRCVAEWARGLRFPLVVDPVMVSKHGDPLLAADAVKVLREELLPQAYLVTPNLHEASALTGLPVSDVESMERAAQSISSFGPPNVLIKGGALSGKATDLLWSEGRAETFSSDHIDTPHTHGSGCVFSAAIVARLAFGDDLLTTVERAKGFVSAAIRTAPGIGHGRGPLNLFASRYEFRSSVAALASSAAACSWCPSSRWARARSR